MSPMQEVLAARLRRLGMHFDSEQLGRVEAIVRDASDAPHDMADISLMTVAVEAYRSAARPMKDVV